MRVRGSGNGRASSARKGRSTHAEATHQIADLQALADDPERQRTAAMELVRKSRHPDIVRVGLKVLRDAEDPSLRPFLHQKYDWCDGSPERNDSGGIIRAAIIRTLQPIIHGDDLPILQRALASYQMLGLYELCAELRTAALLALNDLDPDLAALYAARFLTDPSNSNSGEPALSSVRLLAAQRELPSLVSIASWGSGNSEVVAEALRNLTDLPASMVPLLIAQYRESEDEQILLGLFDLLLAHPDRAQWRDEIVHFLRSTSLIDLYGLVTMQIVASRDESLIRTLRDLVDVERDPGAVSFSRSPWNTPEPPIDRSRQPPGVPHHPHTPPACAILPTTA